MKKIWIMWLFTLATLCAPGISHAVSCYQNTSGGPVTVTNTLPGNVYVSSSTPNGTVIWESNQITYNVACSGVTGVALPSESIYAWINPQQRTVAPGVVVGIRYRGAIYTTGSVATGYSTSNYSVTFSYTYSIVLIKGGSGNGSGDVNISSYSVFQLDGQGGINNVSGSNLNQILNGTVHLLNPTCSLAPSDVSRTVTLPPVARSGLSSVGSIAGKQAFALTVTKCSAETNTAQFTFQGTGDKNNPYAFANTGTAKGIGVLLGSSNDGSTIRADGTNNTRVVQIQNSDGVLSLFAEYIATAAVQPGTVNAGITVNITYQ